MITALNHICIDAIDLAETERFYCEQLGLSVHYDYIRQGKRFGYMLKIDERSFIEVFELADKPVEHNEGNKHLCFTVEDIDACEAMLQERGVETRNKKAVSDGTWTLWCRDPNGIDIEFNAFHKESAIYTQADRQIHW